ncbi:hypothetical protein J6590_088414 [Homalodisca vitripennis]|nr:hypothetical protein J6590_088414 [Homalodisca vitripennis]
MSSVIGAARTFTTATSTVNGTLVDNDIITITQHRLIEMLTVNRGGDWSRSGDVFTTATSTANIDANCDVVAVIGAAQGTCSPPRHLQLIATMSLGCQSAVMFS